MKLQLAIVCLVAVAVSAQSDEGETCYKSSKEFCSPPPTGAKIMSKPCNSRFGGFSKGKGKMREYVMSNLKQNFQYMLMSTHFGNYEYNRAGFQKLFDILSDQAWNDAIDTIKYIAKRGESFTMDSVSFDGIPKIEQSINYQESELGGLVLAIDMQKKLATDAHALHKKFSNDGAYDPHTSSFLENQFLNKQTDTIRNLAGHVTELQGFLKSESRELALYLFDEYLAKKLN